jgi:signal transduction histidine kinase
MNGERAPIHDVEGPLLRAVVGYRLVATAWMALLGVVLITDQDDPLGSTTRVVAAVGLVVLWTATVTLIALRRPAARAQPWYLVADAAIAIGSIVAADWADTFVFAGGYPLAAVFAALQSRGTFAGMTVAGSLSLTALIRLGTLTDVTAAEFSVVIVYLIVGGVAAWTFAVIRLADRRRNEAEELLIQERTERARAEERAAMAARIHDSVLQTLALIQREGDDARRVRLLARRQERELRDWLYGPAEPTQTTGFKDALTKVCAEIEELAGIEVSLVVVGAAEPGAGVDVLARATREAVLNAAKHADVDNVAVFGEASPDGLSVFVRDRGIGFDPEAVPDDRRGIRESIVGRLEHAGGRVEYVTEPGHGTEVRLHLPWVTVRRDLNND